MRRWPFAYRKRPSLTHSASIYILSWLVVCVTDVLNVLDSIDKATDQGLQRFEIIVQIVTSEFLFK